MRGGAWKSYYEGGGVETGISDLVTVSSRPHRERTTVSEPGLQLTHCPAECRACEEVEALPTPLTGSRLALSSIVTFLLPLVAALAGAWLGGRSPHGQLLGSLLGLGLGMSIARWLLVASRATGRGDP